MRNVLGKWVMPLVACANLLAVAWAVNAEEYKPAMIGLIDATVIAESNLKANLLEVELDTKDNTLCYKIDLSKAGDHFQVWINAHTGTVVRARKPFFSNLWIDVAAGEKLKLANSMPAPTDWLRAIEAETGGSVEYVRFEIEDDQPQYEVGVVTDAGSAEIVIDALTGARKPD